jgi:hypothetical protein
VTSPSAASASRYHAPFITQCLQKVFTPLDLFHILLCYSLNLKLIRFRYFLSLAYPQYPIMISQYPIMSKWNNLFRYFFLTI